MSDDGRGIPCDVHAKTGRPALETVLTVLHAGGKFGGAASAYGASGGLHGVGLSVVNALSARLEARVVRDGFDHRLAFVRGAPVAPLARRPAAAGGRGGPAVGGAATVVQDSLRQRELHGSPLGVRPYMRRPRWRCLQAQVS